MMSPIGTKRTWPDVRLESAIEARADVDFGAVRSVDVQFDYRVSVIGPLLP
jgi:hypothetical protein